MAALWGIHPKRIVFARRVKKAEHVARQRQAHLFLDTFIYGAHSTATDALRGVSTYIPCSYVKCLITMSPVGIASSHNRVGLLPVTSGFISSDDSAWRPRHPSSTLCERFWNSCYHVVQEYSNYREAEVSTNHSEWSRPGTIRRRLSREGLRTQFTRRQRGEHYSFQFKEAEAILSHKLVIIYFVQSIEDWHHHMIWIVNFLPREFGRRTRISFACDNSRSLELRTASFSQDHHWYLIEYSILTHEEDFALSLDLLQNQREQVHSCWGRS